MLNLEKLQSTTLRHKIVARIREAILDGSLKTGQRVVERELAHQLGTSLTATREALIQLETEGLITKRPNSTTHVTELSQDDLGNIFQVRSVLEKFAFAEACRLSTANDIEKLKEIHAAALSAARKRDARAYIQKDFEFHEAVWLITRNPFLAYALKRIMIPLFGFSLIDLMSRKGFDLEEDALAHAPLLEAIARKDGVGVKQAFQAATTRWLTTSSEMNEEVPPRRKTKSGRSSVTAARPIRS